MKNETGSHGEGESTPWTEKEQAIYDSLSKEGKAHINASPSSVGKGILHSLVRVEAAKKLSDTAYEKRAQKISDKAWGMQPVYRRKI